MATFKLTMLFSQLSAASAPNYPVHRIGGWSESWYTQQSAVSNVIDQASVGNGLFISRAGLLANGASIVGARVQAVNPVGPSQSISANYAGNKNILNDIPQMALLMKAPGLTGGNVRRFVLRGIPDYVVSEGEFSPDGVFNGALTTFVASLFGWYFQGRDLTQPKIKVMTIAADGTVSAQIAVPYAVLDMVRILRAKDSGGNLRGGLFQVSAVGPLIGSFKIANWPYGACVGGTVRKDAVVFPAVDAPHTTFSRIVTRRVGRPFTAYRGRRSKRR